jgi:hypothetical protein
VSAISPHCRCRSKEWQGGVLWREVLQIPNQLFFSALKMRFSASEIYVGIIHAETEIFLTFEFFSTIVPLITYGSVSDAENLVLSAEKKQLIWNL